MPCKIIDGNKEAEKVKEKVKEEISRLKEKGLIPGLAVILVGDDPASKIYVNNKEKACQEVGIKSEVFRLPGETGEEELLELIDTLNNRSDIHGILVQLPVPPQIRAERLICAIRPDKDVDGFHPVNVGYMLIGQRRLIPCTPHGCLKMIKSAGVEIAGKRAVVVGRSNIVGKPMAVLLLQENATVTVCHSYTPDLKEVTRQADILVVAVGKREMITGEMVKPGALVLDVGMNRLPGGKVVGDVDFGSVSQVAGIMSRVPGGVGLMTTAMLMENTIRAMNYNYEF